MQDFRKIQAWQHNRELTRLVYGATATFPADERFGLTSQIRRAVVSIGANIAESSGRGSSADKLRFLQMSLGSSTELLHQLITSVDLGFLEASVFEDLDPRLESVRRLTFAYMRGIRGKP
jgi:four helix bundle protein